MTGAPWTAGQLGITSDADPRHPDRCNLPRPASAGGPWTTHGHPISGITITGPGRPPHMARCGGPAICPSCARDAERIRAEHDASRRCPTCQGVNRHTVDMVCMDCGRDYMPDDGTDETAPGLGWKRLMGLWREQAKAAGARLAEIRAITLSLPPCMVCPSLTPGQPQCAVCTIRAALDPFIAAPPTPADPLTEAQVAESIAAARANTAFMHRLAERIENDRGILDRLAALDADELHAEAKAHASDWDDTTRGAFIEAIPPGMPVCLNPEAIGDPDATPIVWVPPGSRAASP